MKKLTKENNKDNKFDNLNDYQKFNTFCQSSML